MSFPILYRAAVATRMTTAACRTAPHDNSRHSGQNDCSSVIGIPNMELCTNLGLISPLIRLMASNPWRCFQKSAHKSPFTFKRSECCRGSLSSHDGCPLALVPINLAVWKRPLPVSGFESVGETHCHLFFRQQTGQKSHFLNRDFRWWPQAPERDSFRSCTTPPMRCEPICWPRPRPPHFGACAPVAVPTNS
jgi:hypothetical protein